MSNDGTVEAVSKQAFGGASLPRHPQGVEEALLSQPPCRVKRTPEDLHRGRRLPRSNLRPLAAQSAPILKRAVPASVEPPLDEASPAVGSRHPSTKEGFRQLLLPPASLAAQALDVPLAVQSPPSRGSPSPDSKVSEGLREAALLNLPDSTRPSTGNSVRVSSKALPQSEITADRKDDCIDEMADWRAEALRLRKKNHLQACELQELRGLLARAQLELRQVKEASDELRLKYSNLDRKERRISAELLEERRKNAELSKQVKAMSQNLISLTGLMDLCSPGEGKPAQEVGGGLGLQKRCFKLVQQNTALTVQARLLARQKGWAEAKASIMQNELTSVYLGSHKRVKDQRELELATEKEFQELHQGKDEAEVVELLVPLCYQHQEAVIDFLTHITHTNGRDIHGFLQGNRVYSQAIRTDCLSALAREFDAHWKLNRRVPQVLKSAERLVHLNNHFQVFDSISKELSSFLGCAHARIWVVDVLRQMCWTCVPKPDDPIQSHQTLTITLPIQLLPQNIGSQRAYRSSSNHRRNQPDAAAVPSARQLVVDLSGQGFVIAAFATQKPVNVTDAHEDFRYSREFDSVSDDSLTKSILCVPILQDGKVKAVVQALNKLTEPEFDAKEDVRLQHLLGSVSLEVLEVCEQSGAATINAKRKEVLLQLIAKQLPCESAVQMLLVMELGLSELFKSKAAALHIVQSEQTHAVSQNMVRLTLDRSSGSKAAKVLRSQSDGLQGIAGQTVRNKCNLSLSWLQLEHSRAYDKEIDLPVPERMVLHTVPICTGKGCLAVCQFVCPERDRNMLADDGNYQPDNISHWSLLSLLLNLVRKHLHVIDPRGHGTAKGGDAQESVPAQEAHSLMIPDDESFQLLAG